MEIIYIFLIKLLLNPIYLILLYVLNHLDLLNKSFEAIYLNVVNLRGIRPNNSDIKAK